MPNDSTPPAMRFAKRVFTLAALYGLLAVPPMFFMERRYGLDHPPSIAHPEFYYGFAAVTLVWQLVYFTIGTDPLRFRPMMALAAAAKLGFALVVAALAARGHAAAFNLRVGAGIDALLGLLFLVAYARTRELAARPGSAGGVPQPGTW
jgi:hypothetical protein